MGIKRLRTARCPNCGSVRFVIADTCVFCVHCNHTVEYEFLDDTQILCTTKANDLVKMIEGN
jgi:uncharacterized OB-fold protein